jgi:hypothetical protein
MATTKTSVSARLRSQSLQWTWREIFPNINIFKQIIDQSIDLLIITSKFDVIISQWWPNYGPRAKSSPPSFNIWPAKVFYITALICITLIFCIYVKKNWKCIFLWPMVKKKLFFMARGKKSLAITVISKSYLIRSNHTMQWFWFLSNLWTLINL